MSITEKQFIQYGNGITTDISQIPFDRFSDFASTSTSLQAAAKPIRARSEQSSGQLATRYLDCSVVRAPHPKSASFPSFRARNDVQYDAVFGSLSQYLSSVTNITATENLTLSFETIPNNAVHHLVVTVPAGSNVIITDELYTKEFYGSIIDVIVEAGARVQYQINSKEKIRTVCRMFRAYVKENAQITWVEKVQHADFYKSSFYTYLEQEHARGYTYGMFLQTDTSQTDIYAATYHLAAHTHSDAVSKGVLRDSARAVHRSLVHIAPTVYDCSGYERQDTLLLSDTAQINAIPNLEIENNQVTCSHGATTTYIDDEKLFYFLSRGLDKKTAEELFVSGHVSAIEEKFV